MYFIYSIPKDFNFPKNFKISSYLFNRVLNENKKKIKYINFNFGTQELNKLRKEVNKNYIIQLKNITNIYNKTFKKNFNITTYERLIGYWLLHYLSQFFFKKLIIESLKKNQKFLYFKVIKHQRPININNFLELLNNENYQNYLFSECIEYIGIKNDKKFKVINNFKIKNSKFSFFQIFKNNFLFIIFLFSQFFLKSNTIISDPHFQKNSFFYKVLISIKSKLRIAFFNFNINDYIFRSKDPKEIYFDKNITSNRLTKFVLKNIPISLSDEFETYEKKCLIIKKFLNANKFISFNTHYYNELFIYLSIFKENSEYITSQHGSGYGMEKFHLSEYFDRRISNTFYTFGWCEDNITQPLTIPFVKSINYNKNEDILFVSTCRLKHFLRYQYSADCKNFFLKSKDNELNFYSYSNYKKKIIFRPHQLEQKSLSRNYKKLMVKYNNINYDKNLKINSSFHNSKICIYDHLGTAFLQSMQLSIPSIVILHNNIELYRHSFKSSLKIMSKCNIVFFDAKKASNFVNNNYKNINLWWDSDETLCARVDFLRKYFNSTERWINEWVDKLK